MYNIQDKTQRHPPVLSDLTADLVNQIDAMRRHLDFVDRHAVVLGVDVELPVAFFVAVDLSEDSWAFWIWFEV